MEGVSLELKRAMSQIDSIIKKFDINATVLLADGLGNGEFKMYHDKPTWSMLRFLPRKDKSMAVHTKMHMKSKPKETERTINSIYNIQGMMSNLWLMNDAICKDFESKVKIEKGESKIIPFSNPN